MLTFSSLAASPTDHIDVADSAEEEEEDGSYDSEDGAGDIKISSSSKEAPANPAGIVPFSSQASKLQAQQKARSKRPGPPGEMFTHAFILAAVTERF